MRMLGIRCGTGRTEGEPYLARSPRRTAHGARRDGAVGPLPVTQQR
jgi:hypothetical protein